MTLKKTRKIRTYTSKDSVADRKVAKFLQESILIDFDFIWQVLLSDRNFATFLRATFDDLSS